MSAAVLWAPDHQPLWNPATAPRALHSEYDPQGGSQSWEHNTSSLPRPHLDSAGKQISWQQRHCPISKAGSP